MSAVKPFRLFLLTAPALLLAACGDGDKADDARTASGQVLQGTISDEMLPLDKVTSEPPLMKESAKAGPSDTASDAAGADAAALDAEQPVVPAAEGAAAGE